MSRYLKATALALGFYVLLQPNKIFSATIDELVSYRGIYDLQLNDVSEKSSVSGFTGRMVYEFTGNKCKGFTTKFRFVSKIDLNDLPQNISDQQVTTIESADGKNISFDVRSYTNQELTKELSGSAKIENDGLKVEILKPQKTVHELKKAIFPSEHTLEIINNALNKKYIFNTNIFDGSEDADKITPTNVIIGKEYTPKSNDETKIMGKLGGDPVWPVNISYFDDNASQDGLPVYRTSFLLYKNGVTRDLIMDYGDFSIKGKLIKIELLDNSNIDCN